MKRHLSTTATILAAFLLAACGPDTGPKGTVTDRNGQTITIRDAYSGGATRLTVSESVARACPEGSAYPACADNSGVKKTQPKKPSKPRTGTRKR